MGKATISVTNRVAKFKPSVCKGYRIYNIYVLFCALSLSMRDNWPIFTKKNSFLKK